MTTARLLPDLATALKPLTSTAPTFSLVSTLFLYGSVTLHRLSSTGRPSAASSPRHRPVKNLRGISSLLRQVKSRVNSSGIQSAKVQKPTIRRTLFRTLTRKNGKEFLKEQQQHEYQFGSEASTDPDYDEGVEAAAYGTTPTSYIVLLLQRITDLARNPTIEWTFDLVGFAATFRNGDFNAYTHGALRRVSSKTSWPLSKQKGTAANLNLRKYSSRRAQRRLLELNRD